jgi:hypothetical protein
MANVVVAIELLLDGLDDGELDIISKKITEVLSERKRGLRLDEVTKIWIVPTSRDAGDHTTAPARGRGELDADLYRYFWQRGFD